MVCRLKCPHNCSYTRRFAASDSMIDSITRSQRATSANAAVGRTT